MKHKIPNTDSIKALAEFWDSHDVTDYEDELEEVTSPIFVRKPQKIQIELLPSEVRKIRHIAALQGVSDNVLLRDWVVERLQVA